MCIMVSHFQLLRLFTCMQVYVHEVVFSVVTLCLYIIRHTLVWASEVHHAFSKNADESQVELYMYIHQ